MTYSSDTVCLRFASRSLNDRLPSGEANASTSMSFRIRLSCSRFILRSMSTNSLTELSFSSLFLMFAWLTRNFTCASILRLLMRWNESGARHGFSVSRALRYSSDVATTPDATFTSGCFTSFLPTRVTTFM